MILERRALKFDLEIVLCLLFDGMLSEQNRSRHSSSILFSRQQLLPNYFEISC
jgi:hypothetical protein